MEYGSVVVHGATSSDSSVVGCGDSAPVSDVTSGGTVNDDTAVLHALIRHDLSSFIHKCFLAVKATEAQIDLRERGGIVMINRLRSPARHA